MKSYVQLQILKELLTNYRYPEPFHLHIKKFFRQKRNMGSRDRRQVREIAFNYFRTGQSMQGLEMENRIVAAHFLVSTSPDQLLTDWLQKLTGIEPEKTSLPVEKKAALLKQVHKDFNPANIFPNSGQQSESIDNAPFIMSHLSKPDVHIYLLSGNEAQVISELETTGIIFRHLTEKVLALPAATPLQNLNAHQKGWFEIMDLSSAKTVSWFQPLDNEVWWDCCAGSGGKSILLKDNHPNTRLVLSDNRMSILNNCKDRMKRAGIKNFTIVPTDLNKPVSGELTGFDCIIWDAPCTGSGTWGRHPENLVWFRKETIQEMAKRQKDMIPSVISALKPGGKLHYITCSVYKSENEDRISDLQKNGLQLIRSRVIPGWENGSNTLFQAEFKNSS